MTKYIYPLFLLVFLIAGCSDENPVSSSESEKGQLFLKIEGSNAPASVATVEVLLSREGYEPIMGEMNLLNNSSAELNLQNIPAGLWNLKVDAKNQNGEIEYSGETTVNVLENVVTQVSISLTAVQGSTGAINLFVTWGDGNSGQTYFIVLDEDALDNGRNYNNMGGQITPNGPQFFTAWDVNDSLASETQRNILQYFQANVGQTITIMSGQTGDEGWFAPNCIPAKWISTNSYEDSTCLSGSELQTALKNYLGTNGNQQIPSQDRLDEIPDVRPLRALGLNGLIDKVVYAVVYDSDISINYDHNSQLGVNGNFQGETLGVVAFRVNEVRTLENFSSTTLPEVQITILNAVDYENSTFNLLDAPTPASSSVPNDRFAPGSPDGYFSLGN